MVVKLNRPKGRPPSISKALCDLMVEHVGNGVPMTVCAAAAGIHLTTMQRWRARGERLLDEQGKGKDLTEEEYLYVKFSLDLETARANAIATRIAQIDVAGAGGQWAASAWWLERQLPQEFGKVDRTELTGAGGGPIQVSQAEVVAEAQRIVLEHMKELEGGQ